MDIAGKQSMRGENPFKYMKGSPRWLSDAVYDEVEEVKTVVYETDDLM